MTIDNFDFGTFSNPGPYTLLQTGLGANTLGGDRYSQLFASDSSAGVNIPFPGLLAFSNDVGQADTIFLEYTSAGTNLVAGGNNTIRFDFPFADQPATVKVKVTDSFTGTNSISLIKILGPGLLDFPYASFIGVDFTSVTDVQVQITPNNTFGGDYGLDLVQGDFVPEPSSLVIAGLGLASLAGYRLSRRKQ